MLNSSSDLPRPLPAIQAIPFLAGVEKSIQHIIADLERGVFDYHLTLGIPGDAMDSYFGLGTQLKFELSPPKLIAVKPQIVLPIVLRQVDLLSHVRLGLSPLGPVHVLQAIEQNCQSAALYARLHGLVVHAFCEGCDAEADLPATLADTLWRGDIDDAVRCPACVG
jgi:hypothetical protein